MPKSIEQLVSRLDALEHELYAYSYAMSQINFAGETQDPPLAAADRGEALAQLDMLYHNRLCSQSTHELLEELSSKADELSCQQQAEVRILSREYSSAADIPASESAEFTRLLCAANNVWHEAKTNNDWESFAPYLDKIVETLIRFANYKDSSRNAYDVWLDEFEPGTSREFYDAFFEELKATVVPLVAKIAEKDWQPSRACIDGTFDKETQLKLSRALAEFEGLNMDALVIEESLHPFTSSVTSNHAFITTHIFEDDMISNVYSILHEGGHALYEQGVNPAFNYTVLRSGTSMGIHEAQSRFFENIVGRNEAFAAPLLELIKQYFPNQFKSVSPYEFWQAVNISTPSLIRTEADELTYALHIIIRYEIEQALFAKEISAADVPALWNKKYKEYLGIDVPNDSVGALQDTHWSGGAFGYFPTYALGSAYGAQFLAKMKEEGINFEENLASGNLSEIRTWLSDRIWQYGRSKDPKELIEIACGEAFSAHYFCEYLEEKFNKLYNLQ